MARRKKIPQEVETQVLLHCGRRCCLCCGLDGDSRQARGQIAHLDRDSSNNDPDNLVFLCMKHHDEYDSCTSQSKGLTASEVKEHRSRLYQAIRMNLFPKDSSASAAISVSGSNNIVAGRDVQVGHITIRTTRKKTVIPDTVATEPVMHNYLQYLVARYQEFKAWDCRNRGQEMRYPIIYQSYKAKMKCPLSHTPITRFRDAVEYLQGRIDDTIIGRKKRTGGESSYQAFEEYAEENCTTKPLLHALNTIENAARTSLTIREYSRNAILKRFRCLQQQFGLSVSNGLLHLRVENELLAIPDASVVEAYGVLVAEKTS